MTPLALAAVLVCAASHADAQVLRLSVDPDGREGNAASGWVGISGDGRVVAFGSTATNLVPGDTNNAADLFIRDLQTGVLTRVPIDGNPAHPSDYLTGMSLSHDGRYIAFATNVELAPLDRNHCNVDPEKGCTDVYVYDRVAQTFTLVSATPSGAASEGGSLNGIISGDGRFVLFPAFTQDVTPAPPAAGSGRTELHLRDLVNGTTRRIDVPGFTGYDGGHAGYAMSADAGVVAFSLNGRDLPPVSANLPCRDHCPRLLVFTRYDGLVSQVTPTVPVTPEVIEVGFTPTSLSADGRYLVFLAAFQFTDLHREYALYVHDRVTNDTSRVWAPVDHGTRARISRDGRVVAVCAVGFLPPARGSLYLFDRAGGPAERPSEADPIAETFGECDVTMDMSEDGNVLAFDSSDSFVASPQPGGLPDAYGVRDVFATRRDRDGDGMPSTWETAYGLNPASAADGAGDDDGDGVSNLDEYRAGTHPRGSVRRYFAEGAANDFFSTALHLFNPGSTRANVLLTFLGSSGARVRRSVQIAPGARQTIAPRLDAFPLGSPWGGAVAPFVTPDASFSTVIEADALVVAERDMSWGRAFDPAYGSHAETAVAAPRTEWHFAEGATGIFNLYYLLQNPGDEYASVNVKFLLPAPAVPIEIRSGVGPHSRLTLDINSLSGLEATEVSAMLTSTAPILAERAMYRSTPDQFFAAGHDGSAVAEPALDWFVAEGATGFFSLYLLVENPGAQAADLDVTYLLPDGGTVDAPRRVEARSRLTIDVAGESPLLGATPVSAKVHVRNGVPVVVERVMWWPAGEPYEATLTAGATTTARRWGVASAARSPGGDVETYLLAANPGAAAGTLTVTLTGVDGDTPRTCQRTVEMPALSRVTVAVGEACAGQTLSTPTTFSGIVESSGPPIVVERATYGSTPGRFWSRGAAAALTPLPDVP